MKLPNVLGQMTSIQVTIYRRFSIFDILSFSILTFDILTLASFMKAFSLYVRSASQLRVSWPKTILINVFLVSFGLLFSRQMIIMATEPRHDCNIIADTGLEPASQDRSS